MLFLKRIKEIKCQQCEYLNYIYLVLQHFTAGLRTFLVLNLAIYSPRSGQIDWRGCISLHVCHNLLSEGYLPELVLLCSK